MTSPTLGSFVRLCLLLGLRCFDAHLVLRVGRIALNLVAQALDFPDLAYCPWDHGEDWLECIFGQTRAGRGSAHGHFTEGMLHANCNPYVFVDDDECSEPRERWAIACPRVDDDGTGVAGRVCGFATGPDRQNPWMRTQNVVFDEMKRRQLRRGEVSSTCLSRNLTSHTRARIGRSCARVSCPIRVPTRGASLGS